MEEGMVYQDEDGNMVMYGDGDQMMGSDEDEGQEGDHHRDMMGDSYGMEGSPGDVTTTCALNHLGRSRYELRREPGFCEHAPPGQDEKDPPRHHQIHQRVP